VTVLSFHKEALSDMCVSRLLKWKGWLNVFDSKLLSQLYFTSFVEINSTCDLNKMMSLLFK